MECLKHSVARNNIQTPTNFRKEKWEVSHSAIGRAFNQGGGPSRRDGTERSYVELGGGARGADSQTKRTANTKEHETLKSVY